MEGLAEPGPAVRLRRNLALDLVAAVGVGATMGLVWTILPTVARRGGIDPVGLAALAAAPFLANLLGVFAGRLGPRSIVQLAWLRAGGASLLVLFLIAPTPPIVVVIVTGYWLSLSFGGPFHLRLWGAIYPPRLRGRVIGAIGMSRAAAGAAAALAAAVAADRLGGDVVLAVAGLVGVACAAAYAGLRASTAQPEQTFSARDSVRALRSNRVLRRMALAQGFYGGGLIAASPLYALVHVDRLGLSLGDVAVLGILSAMATTASFVPWGYVADRCGSAPVLRVGSILGIGCLAAYVAAPGVELLWPAAVAFGLASAAIDVGIAAAISQNTPLEQRAPTMAGWNAITGIRGVAAPFALGALVQAGLVDVNGALLVCAVTAGVGCLLFVRMHRDQLLGITVPSLRRPPAAPAPAAPAAAAVASLAVTSPLRSEG